MDGIPTFEAEIIIDEKGQLTVRNCSREMIELLYQLNPNNKELQRRIAVVQQIKSRRSKNEHSHCNSTNTNC